MANALANKLNLLLDGGEKISKDFEDLLLTSTRGFKSRQCLKNHLHEGALLNVGILASKALSIPSGEYMVWMTDAGHTMLVPTKSSTKDVFENVATKYDIFTKTLLQNWNKFSYLAEDSNKEEEEEETKAEPLPMSIDASSVDRKPLLRAMQDQGITATELANKTDVDTPMISRVLRTPKDTQGDPGGRNPSMGLASRICHELRLDPTAAFPDLFGSIAKQEPKDVPKNRGSGMTGAAAGSKRKGKATRKWTQGSND
jgi:hypothetical protein